ncbi:MAG TPA: hypothetical protein VG408_09150 [Actinomycetota bacterium]|nr:hypothetical protein [Actinomycetota bacterium]
MPKPFTILVCALLLAGCVPAEESNDRIVRYQPDKTIMGAIQAAGVLRVGLPEGSPPWALQGSEGFLVELAELVADSLGVEAEYRTASSVELMELVHVTEDELRDDDGVLELTDAEVDLAFPLFFITERLVLRRTITDPYWVGHTRTLEKDGRTLAVGRDVELLISAYRTEGALIAGPQDSTEGYGAVVRTGASTFATLVSQVFNEADAEGDWERFYETWLADYFTDEEVPIPIMTVEDAAALYPTSI